jgi:hypothetical protein
MPCLNDPFYLLRDLLHQLRLCLAALPVVFLDNAEGTEVKRLIAMRRVRPELDDANLLVLKDVPRVRCDVTAEPIENQIGKSGRGEVRQSDSERIWKKSCCSDRSTIRSESRLANVFFERIVR